eukprot:CAMPEP_0116877926 /NCGR_PEP_ID=MMETSP0463-20121206/9681_1 /TAXON_ID=181622 /ORGANISM="Strombidinopsis sp, Strain SopsisLIS2011" /LENGTH=64 /DNA_ID=CAMNT_0004525645 /DNA_START=382 /DNA_END=579 /DNA_ORIENTATION=+
MVNLQWLTQKISICLRMSLEGLKMARVLDGLAVVVTIRLSYLKQEIFMSVDLICTANLDSLVPE